jgi:hypothetical protein
MNVRFTPKATALEYYLASRGFALIASRRGTTPLLFRKSYLSHPRTDSTAPPYPRPETFG